VPALAGAADDAYDAMVTQAQSMPRDYDFDKLRSLYAQREGYTPYAAPTSVDFEPFFKRAEAGDKTVLADVEQYVREHFALIEAHSHAMIVARKLGDENKAVWHEWAVRGLVTAMRASGDARSQQSAPKPLVVSEEYLVARQFGDVESQRLVDGGDHHAYDVLTVKNPATGETADLWFDVTHMLMTEQ
jgi:hypothetical protein